MPYGFRKSIWGRYLGLDSSYRLHSRSGFKGTAIYLGDAGSETLSDVQGFTTVTNYTSVESGSTIPNRGIAGLGSTSGSTSNFTIAVPVAGVRKGLVVNGLSTAQVINTNSTSVAILSSTGTGSTHLEGSTTVTFTLIGQSLELVGLSATRWGLVGKTGAPIFSTGV